MENLQQKLREGLTDLNELFESRRERLVTELRELARHWDGSSQELWQRCSQYVNATIGQFVFEIQDAVSKMKLVDKERLKAVCKELKSQRVLRAKFREEQRRVSEHDVTPAPSTWVKLTSILVEAVVLGASMVIFQSAFPLIFPEQPKWIGIPWSILLLAPSFFLVSCYERVPTHLRQRLVKLLNWIGLGASILFLASYYSARGLALKFGGSSSITAASFFNSGFSFNLFSVVSVLSLISSMFVELCFASLLAILVWDRLSIHAPANSLANALTEIEREIERLEQEEANLLKALKAGTMSPQILQEWAKAKVEIIHTQFESVENRERQELLEIIPNLPTSVLRTITAGASNGRRKTE